MYYKIKQPQIEKHQTMVISTDGGPVKPHTVDTLISISGERYDFVLNADQPPGRHSSKLCVCGKHAQKPPLTLLNQV